MGGGEDLAERRSAQDERATGGVIDPEGEVGLPLSDPHELERPLQAGVLLEPGSHTAVVDARGAHRIVYPPSTAITCPVQ